MASLTLTAPAYAASPVSLTLSPAEVAVAPGGSASGTVLVENSGTSPQQVRLTTQPTDPSVSAPLAETVFELPANGSKSVAYTIHREANASADKQTINFVAAGEKFAAVTTLTVVGPPAADILHAEFRPSLGTLNEFRPGQTTLVITNKRGALLEIKDLTVTAPADVALLVSCATDSAKIEPGATETIPVDACAGHLEAGSQAAINFKIDPEHTLAPGSRSLKVVIAAMPSQDRPTTVVVTGDFILEVFAESAILSAIGVPVFLLLPGVIILLTASVLIVRATKWRFSGDPVLKLSFNAVALDVLIGTAISLVFALLYPALTGLLPGKKRDYLRSQGFDDFYWVFFWSFAIGVITWAIALVLYEITSIFRYEPGDGPEDILTKMSARSRFGGRTSFPVVRVGKEDDAPKAVILPRRVGGTEKFVSPRVEVQPLKQGGSDELVALRESIESESPTPEFIAQILKFRAQNLLTVHFFDGASPDIPAPRVASREEIHDLGEERKFVEWKPAQ